MNVAVLVSSCDKREFTWEPFAYSMNKYWPDCPWPVYFMTNYYIALPWNSIQVYDEQRWGASMESALARVEADIILFMCDDYWLTAPTNTRALRMFASCIDQGKLDYIKLNPSEDATQSIGQFEILHPHIALYKSKAQYRTSMQIALWYKPLLQRLLRSDDTIWGFETDGGVRALESDRFAAVKAFDYIHYVHPDDPTFDPRWEAGAVEQGKFTPAAYRYAERERIIL